MHWTRWMAAAMLVPFTWLSWRALADAGYMGLIAYQMATWSGWQVFVDLVIALSLVLLWMFQDARKNGRNVWPYLLVTLTLGSFGPLFYLLLSGKKRAPVAGHRAQT